MDACIEEGVVLAPVFSKCATGGDTCLRCTLGGGAKKVQRRGDLFSVGEMASRMDAAALCGDFAGKW